MELSQITPAWGFVCTFESGETVRLKNDFWLLSRIPVTRPLSSVTGCQAVHANRISSGAMPHLPCVQRLLRDAERHGWVKLLFFLLILFGSLKEELGRVLSGEECFPWFFSNDQHFMAVSSFSTVFSAERCRGTVNVYPMLPPVDLSWLNSKWTFSFRAYAFGLLLENGFWFIAYLNCNYWNKINEEVCGFFYFSDCSQEYTDSTGIDLHEFLINTLKNNPR